MTPCEKLGYKVGDRFEVVSDDGDSEPIFYVGSIVELIRDDKTRAPVFKLAHGAVTGYMARNGYSYHYYSIEDIRPLSTSWTGTGLPPVGCKVQYPKAADWPANCGFPTNKTAVVKAVFKDGNGQDKVALEFTPCNIYVVPAEDCKPIRSERDKAIDDMLSLDPDNGKFTSRKDFCGLLYDAGYRKQGDQ